MNELNPMKIGNIYSPKYSGTDFAGNVYDAEYISPAILTMTGGGADNL